MVTLYHGSPGHVPEDDFRKKGIVKSKSEPLEGMLNHEDFKGIYACGDKLSAASMGNRGKWEKSPLYTIVEFEEKLDALTVDPRDFLRQAMALWDLASTSFIADQSKILTLGFGNDMLNYFEQIRNTPIPSLEKRDLIRNPIVWSACSDPAITEFHIKQQNVILGDSVCPFYSAVQTNSNVLPSQIKCIHHCSGKPTFPSNLVRVNTGTFYKGKF